MAIRGRIQKRIDRVRAWEGDDPVRKRRAYWACYTLCFIATALVALIAYPANGLSMVWAVDGLEQFYPYFVFEGQWLREIVDNLLSGQGFLVPMWSYDLGYGADIIAELDVIFDPLNLLSGLCPPQFSEFLFQFLVVFRLYLAGAAFSLLAFRFGCGRFPTLLAAVLYALSGTALAVAYWPASAWPLILFPLLLLGVEHILAGKRPYLFVLTVAAFFIISYYFSYMACLLLVPYCAARVILVHGRMGVGRFLMWVLRFAGYLVVGILIAGIALGPLLTELFQNERFVDVETVRPLLYPFTYYARTVSGFLGTAGVGSDCYIGYGGVALLACALLFMRRKSDRLLKAAFAAMVVVLFVPALGSVFNGFNYATNRWVWAFSLLVCFIVAKMLPDLLRASTGEAKKLAVAAGVFCALVALLPPARTEKTLAACAVLAAVLFVVAQRGMSERTRRAGMALCLVAGLAVNSFYFISPDEGGVGKDSPRIGSLYDKLTTESPNSLVAGIDDDGAWRYDADAEVPARPRNDSLVQGLSGIDFYNSFYNGFIDAYHTELGVLDTKINFSYRNLGGRAALDTLAGVKYFLTTDAVAPPYNYRSEAGPVVAGDIRGRGYRVFEAENPLPLAYVYDVRIPRSVYDGLTMAQRQESLLQGVVLEDSSLPEANLDLESQMVPATLTAGAGLSVEDGVVRVTAPGAVLGVSFAGLPDSETYLCFDNLAYRGLAPSEVEGIASNDQPWYRKLAAHKKDLEWSEPLDYRLTVHADKGVAPRRIENFSKVNHLYGGKSDWLANMGYAEEPQTSMTVVFDQVGEYTFDELSVVCQPMGSFDGRVEELTRIPVEQLELATNAITASVDAERACAVFLSVPYSKGWSASVDGKPVEIERANTGFMAVEVEQGYHDIRLTYTTPGLGAGALATGIGVVLLALIAAVREMRERGIRPHAAKESA